jgi:hypothetical protein
MPILVLVPSAGTDPSAPEAGGSPGATKRKSKLPPHSVRDGLVLRRDD